WSNEDVEKLHTLATPEMVSYFSKDLEENKARNDINKISNVKLLQGDLAEAWREGDTDYGSVAMRFSPVDKTLERTTNRVVAGIGAVGRHQFLPDQQRHRQWRQPRRPRRRRQSLSDAGAGRRCRRSKGLARVSVDASRRRPARRECARPHRQGTLEERQGRRG